MKEIEIIAEAMLDKKAKNVCALDLRNVDGASSITDHLVICNADSAPAVIAISDNIEEQMERKCNRKLKRMQGRENAFWIILDYFDIVVHVFQTEHRNFYRLEDMWADGVRTNFEEQQ